MLVDAFGCFEKCVRYCSFKLCRFQELAYSVSCYIKELRIYSWWLVAAKRATVLVPFLWWVYTPNGRHWALMLVHCICCCWAGEMQTGFSEWMIIGFDVRRKPMSCHHGEENLYPHTRSDLLAHQHLCREITIYYRFLFPMLVFLSTLSKQLWQEAKSPVLFVALASGTIECGCCVQCDVKVGPHNMCRNLFTDPPIIYDVSKSPRP